MTTKKTVYKRLGHNPADGTYKLTIPPAIIEVNEWTKGMTLYFRNLNGIFRYSSVPDELARKMKLHKTNVWYVHVPFRIIEHLGYKKRQQFEFSSGSSWVKFNPFEYGTRLVGVAKKPKQVVNNLPYFNKPAEGVKVDEDLQQVQN